MNTGVRYFLSLNTGIPGYTGIAIFCHFFDIFDNFLTFLSFFPKIFFQYLPNFFPHVLVSVPYVLKYVINTIIPNHIAIFLTFLTVFVNFYHFFDIFWRLFRLKITKNILRYPGIILQIPVRYLGQKRVRYPGIRYTGITTLTCTRSRREIIIRSKVVHYI